VNDDLRKEIGRDKEEESAEMPHLPDGVGISYEDMAVLLAAKHDSGLTRDDPVLMLVTICNVCLGEMEKLHTRHNQALAEIIAAKTSEYVSGVKQTTAALTTTLSDASVEGVRRTFNEQSGRMKTFESKLFWCAGLISVSAFINAVLFILK
jgi:hypothetical protein